MCHESKEVGGGLLARMLSIIQLSKKLRGVACTGSVVRLVRAELEALVGSCIGEECGIGQVHFDVNVTRSRMLPVALTRAKRR